MTWEKEGVFPLPILFILSTLFHFFRVFALSRFRVPHVRTSNPRYAIRNTQYER